MGLLEVKVVIEGAEPAVTRTLQVPAHISLDRLHLTIQAAMGWENAHLYQFCIGEPYQWGAEVWVAPGFADGPENLPADKTTLGQAIAKADGAALTYLYDFGDDWIHRLEVGESLDAEPGQIYPRLTDVAGACPPEDIGGPPGFEMFKRAMADAKHPEHADLKDWYGSPFRAEVPDSDAHRLAVLKLARRWTTEGS